MVIKREFMNQNILKKNSTKSKIQVLNKNTLELLLYILLIKLDL